MITIEKVEELTGSTEKKEAYTNTFKVLEELLKSDVGADVLTIINRIIVVDVMNKTECAFNRMDIYHLVSRESGWIWAYDYIRKVCSTNEEIFDLVSTVTTMFDVSSTLRRDIDDIIDNFLDSADV